MTAPLARDQFSNRFEVPEAAVFWRVRRQTGGRPSTVLGPDGEPLFVAIGADRAELREHGCAGSLRLEAVDADQKTLDAPVAFVELAPEEGAPPTAPAASANQGELVRCAFDSMTKTMEAMQRAQVERERSLAQREKSITETQVATTRMHVDIITAVLNRFDGGKQPDPVALVKQQFAMQKAFSDGVRNSGFVPTTEIVAQGRPAGEDDRDDEQPGWMQAISTLAPVAQLMIASFVKGDPAQKAMWQKFVGDGARAFTGGKIVTESEPPAESAEPPSAASEGEAQTPSVPPPKVIRQVLASLDDEDAQSFAAYFGSLTEEKRAAIIQQAMSVGADERVDWARRTVRAQDSGAQDSGVGVSSISVPGLPAEILPVLEHLSDAEIQTGFALVSLLDLATTTTLLDTLKTMSPKAGAEVIKRMIAKAELRSASVAQRAVHSVLATMEAQS